VDVGIELVLEDVVQRGVGMGHDVVRQQRRAPICQQRHLVLVGHGERVDVVVRDPLHIAVRRLVGELDAFGGQRPRQLGDGDRLLGHANRCLWSEVDPRREPPRPVVDDPHREAEVLAVLRPVESRVMQAQIAVAAALDAKVTVLTAQLAHPRQGGVGELARRQPDEGWVDLGGHRRLRGRSIG
jgi:hypothetical protein